MKEITVIYDGECELCRNSLSWTRRKLEVNSLDFHTADLARYSLTKEQCAGEVVVISGEVRVGGAEAVIFLLNARGKKYVALLLNAMGPLAHFGYRWVASHRNSLPVKALSRALA